MLRKFTRSRMGRLGSSANSNTLWLKSSQLSSRSRKRSSGRSGSERGWKMTVVSSDMGTSLAGDFSSCQLTLSERLRVQAVTHVSHRVNQRFSFTELGPEPSNVDIYGSGATEVVVAPHLT
ncbi:MAG: hypothetical protein RLZZ579_621 [Actinomycetota bacterium]